jgi:hypothetical protein
MWTKNYSSANIILHVLLSFCMKILNYKFRFKSLYYS